MQSRPGAVALFALTIVLGGCAGRGTPGGGWIPLFDGETLTGWEGSEEFFRVEAGSIVGGRDTAPIPRNEFLCSLREWGDFELELRFLLDEGVNSGVQFRSQRVPGSHEAIGYQADLGEGYWGAIYDESRRNAVLAAPPDSLVQAILDRDGWNYYSIVAEGPRVRLYINRSLTVDYREPDASLPQHGRICLQIHSGPAGEARFFDVRLRELD